MPSVVSVDSPSVDDDVGLPQAAVGDDDTNQAFELDSASYQRICKLDEGGMGSVELCMRRAGTFVRLYAIKRLHPHMRDDAAMRSMFLDEARIAGLIRHANVVPVLDLGQDAGGPFLVMDYVDGVSLGKLLKSHADASELMPIGGCARLVAQAARGLHAAHELAAPDGTSLRLVHRDVSPQNILIGRDGVARMTDFGIAKAFGQSNRTSTGLLKGKAGYMSPEQLRFEPPDRRSDLFALGVVLFESLTLRRLFKGPDAALVARQILNDPPPDLGDERPEAPPELVQLSFELLAKDANDRPDTAAEVAERLEEIAASYEAWDVAADVEARFGELLESRRRASEQLAAKGPVTVPRPGLAAPALRRRSWVWPLAVGGGLVAAAIVYGATQAEPPEVAPSTTPAASTSAPEEVTLLIESRPPGARVRVGEHVHGTAPVEITVPRGEDPLALHLDKDGFEPSTQELVPAESGRVLVVLTPTPTEAAPPKPEHAPKRPRRARRRGSKRAASSKKGEPGSPFRRFD